jgi:predicted naringenin-chalcone synthase
LIEQADAADPFPAAAFGPGFSAEALLWQWS